MALENILFTVIATACEIFSSIWSGCQWWRRQRQQNDDCISSSLRQRIPFRFHETIHNHHMFVHTQKSSARIIKIMDFWLLGSHSSQSMWECGMAQHFVDPLKFRCRIPEHIRQIYMMCDVSVSGCLCAFQKCMITSYSIIVQPTSFLLLLARTIPIEGHATAYMLPLQWKTVIDFCREKIQSAAALSWLRIHIQSPLEHQIKWT